MTINDDTIQLVDQRIRLHDKQERSMGTVVSRATTGPSALVLFDGSTAPMPVKCMGHVFCQANDRVALERYGSDWLVTGSFSGPGFGEAHKQLDGLAGATSALTSSTFLDLADFGTVAFTKFHDNTSIRLGLQMGATSSATFTQVAFAVRLSVTTGGAGYTPTDYTMGKLYFTTASIYGSTYATRRVTGVPAGTYSAIIRWRRISGSGNITADTNTAFALELDERVSSSSPTL